MNLHNVRIIVCF